MAPPPPGDPGPASAAAVKQPAINGHGPNVPTSSSSPTASKQQDLTDTAESKAALAAIDIVEHHPSPSSPTPSPISRALTKRVKAITKKLQRISQYEGLPTNQLNQDQKVAIASRPQLQAALKELQEVARALDEAEKQMKVEEEARVQSEGERRERDGKAAADEQLLLVQQILRLFTQLHVPQLATSLSASDLSSITSEESAAISHVYQQIVSRSLYTGAEPSSSSAVPEEGSVQQLLALIEAGSTEEEVSPGVSYARVKELVKQVGMPSSSASAAPVEGEDVPQPPEATQEELAKQDEEGDVVKPDVEAVEQAEAQEVAHVAPDLVEAADSTAAPSETSKANGASLPPPSAAAVPATSPSMSVAGISFLQSSDVQESEPVAESTTVVAEVAAPSAPVAEPEGGVVDSAMPAVVEGEASQRGAEAGQGIAMGSQQAAVPQAQVQQQASRFDWSADVEGDDDLGDPMEAFPDSAAKKEEQAAPAPAAAEEPIVAAPLQKSEAAEPSTPPLSKPSAAAPPAVAAPATTSAAPREQNFPAQHPAPSTSTTPARPPRPQHHHPHHQQQQQQSQQQPPLNPSPRKGPIVDEDGFVLQTSKRTQHLQQQQQQQQQQQFRGRGRGRGRVGRAGAMMGGAGRGGGPDSGSGGSFDGGEQGGGAQRGGGGGGRGRGRGRGGRGGAAGAGSQAGSGGAAAP